MIDQYERHRITTERFGDGESCDLDHEAEWPYECDAKDEHPEYRVIVCRNHLVWWTEAT